MNHDDYDMHNNFSHKLLVSSKCSKFLDLNTDNKLSWKNYINYHDSKVKWGLICSKIFVTYQQHWHAQINLFCLFSLFNEVWNNFLG
jgi:hypothetical protein